MKPRQDVQYKVNEMKCKTTTYKVAQKFSRFHLFKETSKKKRYKEKSGVTLVVIHIGICQLPTCCDHTKPMLYNTHHVNFIFTFVK